MKNPCSITPEPQGDLFTYSIQNEYEWGRVIIDPTRNMIFCYTGVGRYCYSWSHPGKSFLEFLTNLNFGYFMDKCLIHNSMEFKVEETIKSMKRHILEYRRDGAYTKEQAREMRDNLEEAVDESSETAFFYIIRDGAFSEHCCDWWEFGVKDYSQDCYEFWRVIWTPLMAYIKTELKKGTPA